MECHKANVIRTLPLVVLALLFTSLVWADSLLAAGDPPSKQPASSAAKIPPGKAKKTPTPAPIPTITPTPTPRPLTWTSKSSMPTPRGYLGVAGYRGEIYAMGGMVKDTSGNWSVVGAAEVYDPSADSWRVVTDMDSPRGAYALVYSDAKLYAIGGADASGQMVSSVDEYDPLTGSWTARAPMPTARIDIAAAAGRNGNIYVFGGLSAPVFDASVTYEYDPVTDTWAVKAPVPHPRFQGTAATGPDGRIYFLGGDLSGGSPVSTVDIYDPVSDAWTSGPSMPVAVSHAQAVTCRGSLFVLGGGTSATAQTNLVQRFDFATGQWSTDTSMPVALRSPGAACYPSSPNGELYVVGGDPGTGSTNMVFKGGW